MFKSMNRRRRWSLLALGAAVVGAGLGAGAVQVHRQYFVEARPAAEIIDFDGATSGVGLLDTRTGAVYRLRGDLDNPAVRNTWELRVPPVREETSGALALQRPTLTRPDAVFLVDLVTGRTWILRDRASSNASWDPVEPFEHSRWGG